MQVDRELSSAEHDLVNVAIIEREQWEDEEEQWQYDQRAVGGWLVKSALVFFHHFAATTDQTRLIATSI